MITGLLVLGVLIALAVIALLVVAWIVSHTGGQTVAVSFDDEVITCPGSNGKIQQMRWDDLGRVLVETTDGGPAVCDVFWVLLPNDYPDRAGVVIPSDTTGMSDLLDALQSRLSGFDNEAVIKAMGSTDNQTFEIWTAEAPPV
ncbi:MAG: hypothetical protein AAF732_12175 [Pseudomonadota bacterium]